MLISYNKPDIECTTEEDVVIHFPDGIPAFGDIQNFSISGNDEFKPFIGLNSVDDEGIGLLCISPFKLVPDYKITLNKGNLKKLMVADSDDVLVLALVTQAGDPEDFVANLLAPLVINMKHRLAKQVILEKHPVRVNVMAALMRARSSTMGRN